MKKLLLVCLSLTFSVYPVIVQTVALQNKITGKRLVFFGDAHVAKMPGVDLEIFDSSNELKQLDYLKAKVGTIKLCDENTLFLLEDFTKTPAVCRTFQDHGICLVTVKNLLKAQGLNVKNIDYRSFYAFLSMYAIMVESMEKLKSSISDPEILNKSVVEIFSMMPGFAEKMKEVEQELIRLGLDKLSLKEVYDLLRAKMQEISTKLIDEYPNNSNLASDLCAKFHQAIENTMQAQEYGLALFQGHDHLDIKAILEILNNPEKNIVCYVGANHISRIIESIQDAYEIIYNSQICYKDGFKEEYMQPLTLGTKLASGIAVELVDQKDFDYMDV